MATIRVNQSSLVHEVKRLLFAGEPYPDSAPELHDLVELQFMLRRWDTDREVFVPERGDGQRGRIDLVATKNHNRVAIELDNRTPRTKSLYKLQHFDCDLRVIAVRGRTKSAMVDGILVVGLEVSP